MIMRLVFFFVLSLSLHAAALVYPVSFGGRSQVDTIQVKILPIEQEEGGAGGQGGSGKENPLVQAMRNRIAVRRLQSN